MHQLAENFVAKQFEYRRSLVRLSLVSVRDLVGARRACFSPEGLAGMLSPIDEIASVRILAGREAWVNQNEGVLQQSFVAEPGGPFCPFPQF